VSLPEVEDDGLQVPSSPAKAEDRTESQLAVDELVEDSMIPEAVEATPVREPTKIPEIGPSTPRRSSRLSQSRARETPTPKSDAEEFVDAPTSPLPPTPRQAGRTAKQADMSDVKQQQAIPADNTSFEISDLDEKSLLRLVVELDSGKSDRSEYHRPSPSVSPDGKRQGSPIIDCIVVGKSPEEAAPPAPPRMTRASSAASAMSYSAEPESLASSQTKPRAGRQKRKRASSKAHGASPKRKRHDSSQDASQSHDSQTAAIQEADVEVHASAEMPTVAVEAVQKEEIYEERIPSSSAEPSSSESHSQESGMRGSAAPETGDAMEVEEDDQDVQSQIALEFSHSQRQDEESRPSSEEDSVESPSKEELMQADIQQPMTGGEEGDKAANKTAGPVTNQEETAPEASQAQKIMALFRNGLDELRVARLSRQEVFQIEEMFMDMRRELIEAERRGRT
jgi:hypothetical protein